MEMKVLRKKWHLYLLVILLAIVVLFSPPLSTKAYTLSIATLQGNAANFADHKIPLGFDFLYSERDEEKIVVNKILPYFSGYDQTGFLTFRTGLAKRIQDHKDHCSQKPESCQNREFGSYVAMTIPIDYYVDEKQMHFNLFFSDNCDIYASHIGEPYGEEFRSLIDAFFQNSCN